MRIRTRVIAVCATVGLFAGAAGLAASASPAFAEGETVSGVLRAPGYDDAANLTVDEGTPVSMQASADNFTPENFDEVEYLVYSDYTCSGETVASSSFDLYTDSEGTPDIPESDPVDLPAGEYYWRINYFGGESFSTGTSCGDNVLTVLPPVESSGPDLSITKTGAPTTVTAGNSVQYTLTVTDAEENATGVVVNDTLPAGTTFVSSTPSQGSCAPPAAGHVICTLGAVSTSTTATIQLVIKTATVVPGGGTITNTATVSSDSDDADSDDNFASATTTVVAPTAGQASGYVPPGGSINTGGTNPATLALPAGPGAVVMLTQAPGNFCAGACTGPATEVNNFPGYSNPKFPISLTLAYAEPNAAKALADFLTTTVYKQTGTGPGVKIRDCVDNPAWTTKQKQAAALRRTLRLGTQSGIANPSPCVDARSIVSLPNKQWRVTYTVLYLSGDPHFGRK
jgi:uncharacterized repeat protein (TIGR01451 family)